MTSKLCETVCAVSSYVGFLAAIGLGSAATAEESTLLFAAAAACNVTAVALRIIGCCKSAGACKYWYNYVEGVLQTCSTGCLIVSAFMPTNVVLGGFAVGVSIAALIVRFVGDLFLFWKQDRVNEQVVESVQLVEVRVEPFSFINSWKMIVSKFESLLSSLIILREVKETYSYSDKLCEVRRCLFKLLEMTNNEEERKVILLMLEGELLSEEACLDGRIQAIRLRAEKIREAVSQWNDRLLLAEKGLLSKEEIRLLRCSLILVLDEALSLQRDIKSLVDTMRKKYTLYCTQYCFSIRDMESNCDSQEKFDLIKKIDAVLEELRDSLLSIVRDQKVIKAFNEIEVESTLVCMLIQGLEVKFGNL